MFKVRTDSFADGWAGVAVAVVLIAFGFSIMFTLTEEMGWRGYLVRRTLKELEERLDPRQFARVHRRAIVNVAFVESLRPASHGERDLLLRDGTRLKLSRVYRDRLRDLL